MKKIQFAFLILCGGLAANSANAATIDFSSFPKGVFEGTLITPFATFKSATSHFLVGNAVPASKGTELCAYNPSSLDCAVDFNVVFNSAVNKLSFVTKGQNPGDVVNISLFNKDNALLGSKIVDFNGLVDLSAFSNVVKVVFDDSSTVKGMAYDNFNFTPAATAVTPIPAGIWLFASALIGLVGAAYRRNPHSPDIFSLH